MKKIIFLLAVTATGFIFYSSLQPAYLSNDASRSLLQYLQSFLNLFHLDELVTNHVLRKLAHFTEFFIQAVTITSFFFLRGYARHKCVVYALLFGFLTAVVDESIQIFVPGRAAMAQDVLLDFFGTLSGTFFGSQIGRKFINVKKI